MRITPVPPMSPPAIWTAFARQAAWKDWVIVALLALNAATVIAAVRVASKQPDVVVVGADGKSSYVPRSVANDALVRFLAEQRQLPSDLTVVRFTRDFLHLLLAINSSTIEGAWTDALALMSPPLRAAMAKDAAAQKLLESYRLAKVRTSLSIDTVELVDRNSTFLHVRTVTARAKSSLLADNAPADQDRLRVELVLRIVPRTMERPDGLEVAEVIVAPLPSTPDPSKGANAAR